jgi:hypothetical protein
MLRKLAVTLLVGATLAGTVSEASANWARRGWGCASRSGWGPFGGWGMSGVGLYGQGFDLGYGLSYPNYGDNAYPYESYTTSAYPRYARTYRYGGCW